MFDQNQEKVRAITLARTLVDFSNYEVYGESFSDLVEDSALLEALRDVKLDQNGSADLSNIDTEVANLGIRIAKRYREKGLHKELFPVASREAMLQSQKAIFLIYQKLFKILTGRDYGACISEEEAVRLALQRRDKDIEGFEKDVGLVELEINGKFYLEFGGVLGNIAQRTPSQDGLFAVTGGEVGFSSDQVRVIKIGSLCIDLQVIAEPIWPLLVRRGLYQLSTIVKSLYYVIQLESLATAKTSHPSIFFVPVGLYRFDSDSEDKRRYDKFVAKYYSLGCGKRFFSEVEARKYIRDHSESFVEEVGRRELLLPFDYDEEKFTDVNDSVASILLGLNRVYDIDFNSILENNGSAEKIATLIKLQLRPIYQLILLSRRFFAHPIAISPMSSLYLDRCIDILVPSDGDTRDELAEFDQYTKRMVGLERGNGYLLRILLSKDFSWLNGLSISQIVLLRECGCVGVLRRRLRGILEKATISNIDDFNLVANEILLELKEISREHDLKVATEKRRFYKDLFVTSVGLVAGAAIGVVVSFNELVALQVEFTATIGAVVGAISGGLKESIKSFARTRVEIRDSAQTIPGILSSVLRSHH